MIFGNHEKKIMNPMETFEINLSNFLLIKILKNMASSLLGIIFLVLLSIPNYVDNMKSDKEFVMNIVTKKTFILRI